MAGHHRGSALTNGAEDRTDTGSQVKFIPFEPEIVTNYSIIISPIKSRAPILSRFIDYVRQELHKLVPRHLIVEID